jgi:hypothetical protein
MTQVSTANLSEGELDVLVSIAIRRAEILEDSGSRSAADAWHEVMVYEEHLAKITSAAEISGGIARVGAIRAALAAGNRADASRLTETFLADKSLPDERKAAIEKVFRDDQERLARHFPALAKIGRLAELREWRQNAAGSVRVFPCAA